MIFVRLKPEFFWHATNLSQDGSAIRHPARAQKAFPQPEYLRPFSRRDAKARRVADELRFMPSIRKNLRDSVTDKSDGRIPRQHTRNGAKLARRPPVVTVQKCNDLARTLRNSRIERRCLPAVRFADQDKIRRWKQSGLE